MNLDRLRKVVVAAHERHPEDFRTLLGTPNVGPATIRSLARIAELIYNAPVSHRDPAEPKTSEPNSPALPPSSERKWADYSFAHGGKDGYPFPVDRSTYDRNITVLTDAVRKARLGQLEKSNALKRLSTHLRAGTGEQIAPL